MIFGNAGHQVPAFRKVSAMSRRKWKKIQGSIVVLLLFMVVISGFSVSAAEAENTEVCTSAAEETAEADGAEVVSVFRMAELEDASREDTCISLDEETAMSQLETLIPDSNFRREVYRSLRVAGQLGTYGDEAHPEYDELTGEELYKAVLQDFTGEIYASGYEKEMGYIYEFRYKESADGEWISEQSSTYYDSREEAYDKMQQMMEVYETALNYTVDEESASVSSIVNITDERKPEEELITDITGITLLRHAEKIDVSHNRITSLMPMDINSLDEDILGSGEFTDLEDARQKWFGEPFRNVEFNFSKNPIDDFPNYMLGRITVNPTFATGDTQYDRNPFLVVKQSDGVTWPRDFVFDMPLIRLGGIPIKYTNTDADGIESLGDNAGFVYSEGDENSSGFITLQNVEKTGKVYFNASIQMGTGGELEENQVKWYTTAENVPSGGGKENINTSASTVSVRVFQALRVLYSIVPEPAVTKMSVSFEKTELNSEGTPVAGAGYTLFKMKTDADGNLIYNKDTDTVTITGDPESESSIAYNQDQEMIAESLSDELCETEENGKFTIEKELSPGWYCFIETAAPEDYELDTTPLMFEVGSADVEISGGTTLTDLVFKNPFEEGSLSYQLYQQQDDGGFKLYNNDTGRYYETDDTGSFRINGLPDGVYQLREVPGEDSTGSEPIKFTVSGDSSEVEENDGQAEISFEKSLYTDSEAPVEINLTPGRDDMQLQSVTVFWYDSEGEERSTIFHASGTSDPVADAEAFINGDHTGVYGPLGVQPVYLQTGELKAEDPKKVSFSFTKTDGDPSGGTYKGLVGAEFTLYRADKIEDCTEENIYDTAVSDEETGIVSFGNLDSGQYIMKETKTPDGYASLPGYWKVTADAKSESDERKLGFVYVRQDGYEVSVSQSDMIPEDAYGNHYYIPNQPVSDLPTMGGPGNRTFMFGGILLMGAACILCGFAVRNKKIKNTQ